MSCDSRPAAKRHRALGTCKRFLSRVNTDMALESRQPSEPLRTAGTLEKFVISVVDMHVQLQSDQVFEEMTTDGTDVRFVIGVCAFVKRPCAVLGKVLVEAWHSTSKRAFTRMSQHMGIEDRLCSKCTSTLAAYVATRLQRVVVTRQVCQLVPSQAASHLKQPSTKAAFKHAPTSPMSPKADKLEKPPTAAQTLVDTLAFLALTNQTGRKCAQFSNSNSAYSVLQHATVHASDNCINC